MPNEGRTADTDDLSHKECRICHIKKHVTNFLPTPANRDGLHSYCDPCRKEKQNRRARERYRTDEEYAKKQTENGNKWNKEHPEVFAASCKKYRENNRDKCLARVVDWQKKNPEKHKANQRRQAERQKEKRRREKEAAEVS